MPEKIVDVKGGGQRVTLEQMRQRLTEFEGHIRDYLVGLDASVENYKFSVEKNGDAFTFDVGIRATVRPKQTTGIQK